MQYFHRKTLFCTLLLTMLAWLFFTGIDYYYFHQRQVSFIHLLLADFSEHEYTISAAQEFFLRVFIVALIILSGLIISHYISRLKKSENSLHNIFDNVIPICITDNSYRIIMANRSYQEIFGPIKTEKGFIKCYDSRPGLNCRTELCPLHQISRQVKDFYTCESIKTDQGRQRHFIVTATPLVELGGRQTGIIETFQDITVRRKLEEEKEYLITELQDALRKVKLLSGFLPICASCKKIRDDKGYWTQIEAYIREHSEAEFSHGICPECEQKLYEQNEIA